MAGDNLEPDQRQAILDWLHWGGQIIVSGPESLDTLGNSFLGPYLPAVSGGTRKFTAADQLKVPSPPFSIWRSWTFPAPGAPLPLERIGTGVRLSLHAEGHFIPGCRDLLAERRVGRGRIVISAFSLTGSTLTQWEGRHWLFNACLLRHPPRLISRPLDGGWDVLRWLDQSEEKVTEAEKLDPRRLCSLRYFSRDAGCELGDIAWEESSPGNAAPRPRPVPLRRALPGPRRGGLERLQRGGQQGARARSGWLPESRFPSGPSWSGWSPFTC